KATRARAAAELVRAEISAGVPGAQALVYARSMSKSRKAPSTAEIALASLGLLLLGGLGYWALERNQPRAPSEPVVAPARDAETARAPGHAPAGRPAVAPAPADAARIAGHVRDLLTGEGVAGVTVAFV